MARRTFVIEVDDRNIQTGSIAAHVMGECLTRIMLLDEWEQDRDQLLELGVRIVGDMPAPLSGGER